MTKRKIELSEEQQKKNDEILARLELERRMLVEETRAMQEGTRRKPGRKRRKEEVGSEQLSVISEG